MRSVGAYEAKTNFSKLLADVAAGDEITITKHGVPIAKLSPVENGVRLTRDEIVERLRRLRARNSLRGITAKELVNEGRRV